MKNPLTLKQVIQGYLLSSGARHLSANTIRDYKNTLNKFVPFIGPDVPFTSITRQHVEAFLTSFKTVRDDDDTSTKIITKKTLLHYHTALSSM